MKKTRWFSGKVRPIRPGVYETQEPPWCVDTGSDPGSTWMNRWDGKRWYFSNHHTDPRLAWSDEPIHDGAYVYRWRGLTKKGGK